MTLYHVTVQWGKGFHYFITPEPVPYSKARTLKQDYLRSLSRRYRSTGRRGAKPYIELLELIERTDVMEQAHD